MYQWSVILNVRTAFGTYGPVVVKVQISEDIVAGRDPDELRATIEIAARETVIDPRGNAKLFSIFHRPLPNSHRRCSARPATGGRERRTDHSTFSDIFCRVKAPLTPFC